MRTGQQRGSDGVHPEAMGLGLPPVEIELRKFAEKLNAPTRQYDSRTGNWVEAAKSRPK